MSSLALSKQIFEFMASKPIMAGLSETDLAGIPQCLELLSFEPGAVIFQEDEHSNDLYLILEGEVNLLKDDEKKQHQFPIGKLLAGEVFGEMSFLDDSPRSCSIKTNSNLTLVKISRKELEASDPHIQEIYGKILRNITKIVIGRLRGTNALMIKNRNAGMRNLMLHNEYGRLLLRLILIMLLTAGICGITYHSESSLEYFPLFNIASLLPLLYFIQSFAKFHGFPVSNFGLTLKNWSESLVVAVTATLASAGVLALIFFSMSQLQLLPSDGQELSLKYVVGYAIYVLFLEFILRGVMQTSIQKFLSELSVGHAIFYIAAITASCNFYFGFETVLIVFVVNFLCGYIYSLKNNLFVSWFAHFTIALMLKMMGFVPYANFF